MSTLWSFGQGLNFELTMQNYDVFLIYTSICVQKTRKVCFLIFVFLFELCFCVHNTPPRLRLKLIRFIKQFPPYPARPADY